MFHQPKTLDEALRIRAQHGRDVTPIAGGTDLVVAMNRGQLRPSVLLDLTHVAGFDGVRRDNGSCFLAGGATHATLERLPVRALAQAALSIGGPAIRNRGTIAGNLATASPAGDGSVALLALDARVILAHAARGTRTIPLCEFFLNYRKTALLDDELISEVVIPADWTTAWYKLGKRGSVNISVVCCAVGRSPQGRFAIAFGSVGPFPLRTPQAEGIVNRSGLTDASIAAAAAAASNEVRPIDDHRASARYRRAMCGTLLTRVLREIRAQLGEPR